MHVESIYLLYQTNVFLYRKVIVINHSEVEENDICNSRAREWNISLQFKTKQTKQGAGKSMLPET